MTDHFSYMHRCLQLAAKGAGYVAPNPMVGAVLVHNNCIIGEGWHKQYGQAHAEVNCIDSVKENDRQFIAASTIYVSLEPCSHVGKTPPCADFIIAHKIPRVIIGCTDSFMKVNGQGIARLKQAGIEVITGILENEAIELNKRFFTFHNYKRPYIILKWAQTEDGFIAAANKTERLFISNSYTNNLAHQWRSEEAAIIVGTNTALYDNPSLTTRHWPGKSSVRIVLDMHNKLPASLMLFEGNEKTIVINAGKDELNGSVEYIKVNNKNIVPQICDVLFNKGIQSVIVEGGATLLQSFINADLWDEARIIVNNELNIKTGLSAPILTKEKFLQEQILQSDKISFYLQHKTTAI